MCILKVIIILFVTSYQYGVEGVRNFSYEKDMELERQLSILNKQSVKTFKMEGVTYDCVNIYRQPALDHPLLKNHKIQMRPTHQPNLWINQTSSTRTMSILGGGSCPQGTVPIRRTQKEDLIRAKNFTGSCVTNIHPSTDVHSSQHIAIIRPFDGTSTYYGGKSQVSIHTLNITKDRHSTAQIWIENGPHERSTSLQAGWMVWPDLGGDMKPRFFIYWKTPDSEGCYNNLCPGFIQVNPKVILYGPISPVSKYGGQQYVIEFAIFQDNVTTDWWLSVQNQHIGYWPRPLVPQLGGGASVVAWGGVASGPPNEVSPPMGNGYFPRGDITKACHFLHIQTLDDTNQYIIPKEDSMQSYVDNHQCYDLDYCGYLTPGGLSFMFGGPGGNCGV